MDYRFSDNVNKQKNPKQENIFKGDLIKIRTPKSIKRKTDIT